MSYQPTRVESGPPLLLDIPEAAQTLRISRSTLYRMLAAGELKSVKIGARNLVTYESCVALVNRLAGDA